MKRQRAPWWRQVLRWFGIGSRTITVRSFESLMGVLDEFDRDLGKVPPERHGTQKGPRK